MAIKDKDMAGTANRIVLADSVGALTATIPYTEGTFTATLTGCTTSPTVTVSYVIVGKMVTLTMQALTGISNTAACSITGMPSALFPSATLELSAQTVRDNTLDHPGMVQLSTAGVMTLFFYSTISNLTSTFTSSGTKGLGRFAASYTLQ